MKSAKVSLTPVTVAATQTLMTNGLSDARLATVASQIAGAVDGIALGWVSISDANGAHLDLRVIQDYDQKAFWTGVCHQRRQGSRHSRRPHYPPVHTTGSH